MTQIPPQTSKFRIEYDDRPDMVVDEIASKLKPFGLTIELIGGGDGFIEYEIKSI